MFGYRAASFAAFTLGVVMTITVTNVLGQEDPYLWLEDVMGEKAIS